MYNLYRNQIAFGFLLFCFCPFLLNAQGSSASYNYLNFTLNSTSTFDSNFNLRILKASFHQHKKYLVLKSNTSEFLFISFRFVHSNYERKTFIAKLKSRFTPTSQSGINLYLLRFHSKKKVAGKNI